MGWACWHVYRAKSAHSCMMTLSFGPKVTTSASAAMWLFQLLHLHVEM
jgi:hypothetical protein